MEKARIAKYVFQVVDKEFITPGYIRVTLNGEGANEFSQCTIGANNKIFIPSAGKKNVLFDELEKPIVRTYTHRGVNVTKSEIVIDFVNHGDNGPASLWARSAVFGDELGVATSLRLVFFNWGCYCNTCFDLYFRKLGSRSKRILYNRSGKSR